MKTQEKTVGLVELIYGGPIPKFKNIQLELAFEIYSKKFYLSDGIREAVDECQLKEAARILFGSVQRELEDAIADMEAGKKEPPMPMTRQNRGEVSSQWEQILHSYLDPFIEACIHGIPGAELQKMAESTRKFYWTMTSRDQNSFFNLLGHYLKPNFWPLDPEGFGNRPREAVKKLLELANQFEITQEEFDLIDQKRKEAS